MESCRQIQNKGPSMGIIFCFIGCIALNEKINILINLNVILSTSWWGLEQLPPLIILQGVCVWGGEEAENNK